MQINADTKIATVLKAHPAALDAIVALSPQFENRRRPDYSYFTPSG